MLQARKKIEALYAFVHLVAFYSILKGHERGKRSVALVSCQNHCSQYKKAPGKPENVDKDGNDGNNVFQLFAANSLQWHLSGLTYFCIGNDECHLVTRKPVT